MFVAAFMRSSLNATAVDYKFLANAGVAPSQVRVDVTTPSALLTGRFSRSTVIDYVNIDVEQLEIAILSVWPWEEFCVRVFNIENEPPKGQPSLLPRMVAMLAPQGYAHMLRIGVDEVFVCTTPCPPATEAAAAASSSGDLSAARVDTTAGGAMPLTQLGLRGSRHEHEHAHEPPSTRRRNRVLNLRAKQHEERRLGRWTQSRRAGQTE